MALSVLWYKILSDTVEGIGNLSEGHMMIICKNRNDKTAFSSKDLFSSEEICGIELNGEDDDFGDEILLRGAGIRSKAIGHRH